MTRVIAVGNSRDHVVKDACQRAQKAVDAGESALQAAVAGTTAVRVGAAGREVEAACMTDDGKFGAVACVTGVPYPALAALIVHGTPHNLIAGPGAMTLARALDLERDVDPTAAHPTAIGVVVWSAQGAAACIAADAPVGRLGLVGPGPLIGCGIMAGPAGVTLALSLGTGRREQHARILYNRLAGGVTAQAAVRTNPNWSGQPPAIVATQAAGHAASAEKGWFAAEAVP